MENNPKIHHLQVTHEEHRKLINENERLRKELEAIKANYNDLHENLSRLEDIHVDEKTLLNAEALETILASLNEILTYVSEMDINAFTMTSAQRRRLLGAGVRRLGFIQQASEIAAENPEFLQGFFTHEDLSNLNAQIGEIRKIMIALQKILRIMTDHYLLTSDEAFRLARLYYVSARDAARNGIPGALPIFNALRPLFQQSRIASDEPTDAEVERDLKALLHGHKDGEIIVENQSPHITEGKRVVVDKTHKATDHWKETEEGEIIE